MTGRFTPLAGILCIASMALILYTIDLGRAPIYLHEAEIMFALHAHSIATTGRDLYGRFLPVYFQMKPIGDNVWFQPAIVYVTALFLQVLPFAEWTVRLPSAIMGTTDVVLIYFVVKRLAGDSRAAIVASMLLALTPAHFIQSRIAMDYIYPVVFVLGWLLSLAIFVERRQPRMLFAATTLLGLGVYSYIASLIMMPLYLGLTMIVLYWAGERTLRAYATAIAGFLWPLMFLGLWVWMHPATVLETLNRYQVRGERPTMPGAATSVAAVLESLRQPLRFSALTGRISLYWYFYDPAYLFLTGGYANVVNSTPHVGVFLAPLAVFVPAGIWRLVHHRPSVLQRAVIVGFMTAPVAACLVVLEPYAIDREMELLPFAVILAAFGVGQLIASPRRGVRVAARCLLAVVPLQFAFFLFEYFGEYQARSAFWFGWNRREALENIIAREPATHPPRIYMSTTHVGYLDAYWRFYLLKHSRTDLLERTVYFDSNAFDVSSAQRYDLILATRDDAPLAALAARGELRTIVQVAEPRDPPFFVILER
jgi:4-amino-4-deoxy-L-arabinose transferase-like glycosyltransferase